MDHAAHIIEKAVGLPLARGPVRRITVEPMTDWQGHDALSVMIVLEDDTLSGSAAATLLTDIHQALLAAGDQRFPILEFATEDELALDGGSQP